MALFSRSDLRDAARGLIRTPAVTLSAVLCLGLGLGVTTAISSALERTLLQPLPFRQPGQLVTVYRTAPQANTWPYSAPNYVDLARESHQLQALAAVAFTSGFLALPDGGAPVAVVRVTGNLFSMLGVTALRGRMLLPADDAPDQNAVAVMSQEFWRDRFGSDPSIVGHTIQLDGRAVTVVGIAPAGFRVPHGGQIVNAPLWVPMRFSTQELAARGNNYLLVMGRLAPGASPERAQSELSSLFTGIVAAHPELAGEGVRIVPMPAEAVRPVRTPLLLLFGAVCIVLLIATTDVASLLLARGVQRRREMAIRIALGGSPWAVMRPVLAESLLLAVIGVAVGLGLSWFGVRTIGATAARRVPQLAGLTIDFRVVAFAVVLSLVVAVLCAALPALRSAAVDPQEALRSGRGGGPGRAHHRALGILVVTEVALSLTLLISAGLVLKGFVKLLGNDPGFDPAPILTLQTTVSAAQYPAGAAFKRFLQPALGAIRQVPGVESAGAIQLVPYVNWGWNFNIRYEGQPGDNPTKLPLAEYRVVTPDFFSVTRQRLISGRLLRESDDDRPESPPVVVVNQALAERDFRGRDPIGMRFYSTDTSFATIVGVVSDIRNAGPISPPTAEVYSTYPQSGNGGTSFPIMVRVRSGDPLAVAKAVTAAIQRIDHGAAVTNLTPMGDVIAASVGGPRFYLILLAVFAVVAVILALAGLYGVTSYSVVQRTHELGIRSALGSTSPRTVGLVVTQGMRLVGIGLLLGLAAGAGVTRLLLGLLYGVSPVDLPTWGIASLLLAAAGLAATVVPAIRATRVDPMTAMRTE